MGQCFCTFRVHQGHLEGLVSPRSLGSSASVSQVCSGELEFECLVSSQVMLMLLVQAPHFENHCSKLMRGLVPWSLEEMGQVLKIAQQGTAYLDVLYTYKDSREDICQSENTVLCWERNVIMLRVLSLSNYWTLTTLYMCCISGLHLRVWESRIM